MPPLSTHAPMPLYQAMAEAFVAEGVDTHFLLTGHGQMHWAIALSQLPGVRSVTANHEHASVAMASGYHSATGNVGVASTTCGPGFTQVMTALTSAANAHVPLVIFAPAAPMGARWYNQYVDQGALARVTGAHVLEAYTPQVLLDHVQEAFYVARYERRPVVISAPYDLLDQPAPHSRAYVPSSVLLPILEPILPHAQDVERVATALTNARLPVIIGGRGAIWAGAAAAIEALADRCGALLGTTLPARGLFDHNPFSLGVVGGYSADLTRETMGQADLVVSFGASLNYYTTSNDRLFPNATVIQIDEKPVGYLQGRRVANLYMRADARLAATSIADALSGKSSASACRTPEVARAIAERPADGRQFGVVSNTVDAREAINVLDRVIPKDWDIVSGTGNCSSYYTHMRGRPPSNWHLLREFGAIGSSLSMAIGVAAARNNGKVVLFDGDGGMMMHIQELESIQRQGIKLLMVALNDGGFGAEFHRLRAIGKDERLTFFGRRDFASIAKGFGLAGTTVTSLDQVEEAFGKYDPAGSAMMIDMHISDTVPSTLRSRTGH